MKTAMKRLLIAGGLALAIGGTAISLAQTNPPCPTGNWCVGDVFVAIGGGKYEVRDKDNNYALKETITSPNNPKKEFAGCWFDSQFNLFAADFNNTKVVKYNLTHPHNALQVLDTEAQADDGHSSSIVMAVNGDIYVGHAGNANGTGSHNILKYLSDGTFKETAFIPGSTDIENRGTDWMDLSTDQKTMYYTSRGRKIFHVNLDDTTDKGSVTIRYSNTVPQTTGTAFAFRLLPPFDGSGGFLVADKDMIRQVDENGIVVKEFDAPNEDDWQALNLDADALTVVDPVTQTPNLVRRHFWAGGFATGRLYRFNLASSTPDLGVTTAIQTAGKGALMGLCVMGQPQLQVWPLQLSNFTGSTVVQDVTAKFGDPDAFEDSNTLPYSFSTWRLRIRVKPNFPPMVAAVSFTPQTTTKVCESDQASDASDFDCRFKTTPAVCVPFFVDPSAPTNTGLNPYRCAYYRVKDMKTCQSASPGNCPFDEPFIPVSATDPTLGFTNDIQSEILMNLKNPPSGSGFEVEDYGPLPKGNPRLMRDPDASYPLQDPVGNQFFIDATTAIIDWPAFGTGSPNDYSPVMRAPAATGNITNCAVFISPAENSGNNSGSNIKIIIEVRERDPITKACTGPGVTGASTAPNNITLAISGGPSNSPFAPLMPVIYCDTPGNSLGCFTPVNGQPGRYQSGVDLTNPPFVPSSQVAYSFHVTSVNVASANQATQNSGIFTPVCRNYFICANGSNCTPAGPPPPPTCQ